MLGTPPDPEAQVRRGWRGFRPSIARTLTLGLALLVLASLGSALWIAMDAARRNTFELQRSLAETTVLAIMREVDAQMGAAQDQVEFLSALIERGEVEPGDDSRLVDLMLGALAAAPQVSGIAFVRADYTAVRAGRLAGELLVLRDSWADRPGIREAMENAVLLGRSTWRAITWAEDFQAPHIVVAEPVAPADGLAGMMFAVVSVSALSAFLDTFDQANKTRSFILYDRQQVLAHASLAGGFVGLSEDKPLPRLGDGFDPALAGIWGEVVDEMPYLLSDSPVSGHVVAGRDDDFIYLYRELDVYGPVPWLVGVYFRGSEVNLPLRRLIVAASFGGLILLVAVACGLLLARSIVRPLGRLALASDAVRRLDLGAVQPLNGSLFRELDVAAKAFDSMLSGLRWFETYVPKSLVLRLMGSGGAAVASEERQVTVLFTDIAGFTSIGAALSPAELATLLNDHFALLAEAIEAEEGTVDKYIGDSIMAFWGAPLDQPDHASRACRAARAMARAMRAENRRRCEAGEAPLGLRVGVHSGPAIVGNIGAPGRVNYTLIGDTVNTAQRLEGLGKEVAPGADVVVLVSAATHAALAVGIGTEGLGTFTLRGREAPLDVFRLHLPEDGGEKPKDASTR